MDYVIAPFQSHQATQVATIWLHGWRDAHRGLVPEALERLRTYDSFLERVHKHGSKIQVAALGPDVLGFCMTDGNELYQMYVTAKARGTGAAQALIVDAEAQIRAAGHATAWLACAIGNARAMRFYEKSGWSNTGRETVQLETSDGKFPLEILRYEKQLVSDAQT